MARRMLFFTKLSKNNTGVLNYALRRRYQTRNEGNVRSKVLFTAPFVASGIFSFITKSGDENSLMTKDALIAKADVLYEQEKHEEIYNLLNNYRNEEDVEILWRLCRAMYNMSKSMKDNEAKKTIYEGYDLMIKAMDLDDSHWAVHKWLAIMLNRKTDYEATKIKINELYNIKKHMVRASELNPDDATTLYMIGNWCYQVADLPWYQRKLATAVFGEPPTSSFEEALHYFERAEAVDPMFYSHNLLMLGKTYKQLNRIEDAKQFLTLAAEYLDKNDDDRSAKQEATNLLKYL